MYHYLISLKVYSTSYLGISSLPSNRPPNERIYVEGREDID